MTKVKTFWDKVYASPYGRLGRRFVIVGVAATLPAFFGMINGTDAGVFDSILGLSTQDWSGLAKLFMGAGILAGLDKLRREWANL